MSWLTGVPRRFEEKSNPKGVNQYSGAGGAGGAGGGKGKGAQRMERLRGKTVFTALSGMADAERGVGEVVQKLKSNNDQRSEMLSSDFKKGQQSLMLAANSKTDTEFTGHFENARASIDRASSLADSAGGNVASTALSNIAKAMF